MKKLRHRIVFITLCLIAQCIYGQYEITGRLTNYDSIWQNKIHLSLIEPNEKISDLSYNQIINSTSLDEQGNFMFSGINLPESNSIIRITLINEQASTLLFSHNPKNYLILIANNKSKINIIAEDFSKDPLKYKVSGDFLEENEKIKEFLLLISNKNKSNPYSKSEKSIKIISDNRSIKIREFCKTTKYPLVNIIALHHLNLDEDYPKNQLFYENLFKNLKLSDEKKSPYIKVLGEKIAVINYKQNYPKSWNSINYLVLVILSIIILCLIVYISYLKKKISNNVINLANEKHSPKDLIQLLTNREKEIFRLIIKEYQNKEIAKELHLEVSTIKTHLSKIYQKLQIKSRTQIKEIFSNVFDKD